MYFPSAEEQRYVQHGLLPDARRQPVADELRGWSWSQPPVKPLYAAALDVDEVAGMDCPTGRDLFLRRVQGIQMPVMSGLREERVLRQVVARLMVEAKRLVYLHGAACLPALEGLLEQPLLVPGEAGLAPEERASVPATAHALRAFEVRRLAERVASVLAQQPHAGPDTLVALALPVSVEVALDGRYLGLSERLVVDGVAFSRMLVLHLTFGPPQPSHRLRTAGYALVLESLFDTPVDLGCVVAVRCVDGRVALERDVHLIGDELRQEFLQARDERMRLVEEELDPGLPRECPSSCPYLVTCRPAGQARRDGPRRAASANRPA